MSDNRSYFAARAMEERRLGMASTDPKVRAIHLEMAAKYAVLAGANPNESPSEMREPLEQPQQKTA